MDNSIRSIFINVNLFFFVILLKIHKKGASGEGNASNPSGRRIKRIKSVRIRRKRMIIF